MPNKESVIQTTAFPSCPKCLLRKGSSEPVICRTEERRGKITNARRKRKIDVSNISQGHKVFDFQTVLVAFAEIFSKVQSNEQTYQRLQCLTKHCTCSTSWARPVESASILAEVKIYQITALRLGCEDSHVCESYVCVYVYMRERQRDGQKPKLHYSWNNML